MRKAVVVLILALAASTGLRAQIATSKHNLSSGTALTNADVGINGQICVFCHTPHGGGLPPGPPLWNRQNTTTAYQIYTSSTLDAAAPTAASIQSSISGACLSCHDGSIALDVLLNLNSVARTTGAAAFTVTAGASATYGNSGTGTNNIMTGGVPFMGADLRNDHPINIIYESARAAQTPSEFTTQVLSGTKVQVTNGSRTLPLFGTATATATVECASCHNPHLTTNGFFLRVSNQGSGLCLTCHIK